MFNEDLKKRILGAIIVVTAVVILFPIFLEKSSQTPDQAMFTEIPKLNLEEKFEKNLEEYSKPSVLEKQKLKNQPGVNEEERFEKKSENEIEASLREIEKELRTLKNNEAHNSKDKIREKARWVLQLGSFSERKNAVELLDKLKLEGYSCYIFESSNGKKKLYKVRSSAFKTRKLVDEAKNMFDKKFGLPSLIVKISSNT